jgi:hypothetical protein
MAGNMHAVSPLVTTVVDDMRHCRRDDNDNHDNCSDNCNNNDVKTRKKMRLPEAVVDPTLVSRASIRGDSGENEVPEDVSCPPRQWWFSRHSLPTPLVGAASNATTDSNGILPFAQKKEAQKNVVSGIVLSEHLGRASDVVESLTHDVKNWSLTRLSTASTTTTTTPTADRKKEKQKQCKDAQRQVRMARRRCLEEQKRILHSSTNPTAMD